MNRSGCFVRAALLSIIPCMLMAALAGQMARVSLPACIDIHPFTHPLGAALFVLLAALFGLSRHVVAVFRVSLMTVFVLCFVCFCCSVRSVAGTAGIAAVLADNVHVLVFSCCRVIDMHLSPRTLALADMGGLVPHILHRKGRVCRTSLHFSLVTGLVTLSVVLTFARRLWMAMHLLRLLLCSFVFLWCAETVCGICTYNLTLLCAHERRRMADRTSGTEDAHGSAGMPSSVAENAILHGQYAKLASRQVDDARIAFLAARTDSTAAGRRTIRDAYMTELLHLSSIIEQMQAEEEQYMGRMWKKTATVVRRRDVPAQLADSESVHVRLERTSSLLDIGMAMVRKRVMACYFRRLCTDTLRFVRMYHRHCCSGCVHTLLFRLQSMEDVYDTDFGSAVLARSIKERGTVME